MPAIGEIARLVHVLRGRSLPGWKVPGQPVSMPRFAPGRVGAVRERFFPRFVEYAVWSRAAWIARRADQAAGFPSHVFRCVVEEHLLIARTLRRRRQIYVVITSQRPIRHERQITPIRRNTRSDTGEHRITVT